MTENTAAAAWDRYWARVGSEEWLTAKALIELCPALHREAAGWVKNGHDLHNWIHDVDDTGRGWSSTETRLFRIVAALIDPTPDLHDVGEIPPYCQHDSRGDLRRLIPLHELGSMGSWEGDVWRILTEWGTGGNNREHAGRYTAVPTGDAR